MHSTDVAEPDRVDVIVSETLGNYPFEENIIATLNDARERFLNPGGTIIPAAVEQFACPVVGERLYRDLAAWDEVGYGLDFAPAKAMSLNNIYVRWLEPADLLDGGAAAKAWDQVRFDRKNKTTRTGEVDWKATPRRHRLRPGAVVGRRPGRGRAPVDRPARPAHALGAALSARAGADRHRSRRDAARAPANPPPRSRRGTNVTWTLSVADTKGKERVRQSLDLEKGFLP